MCVPRLKVLAVNYPDGEQRKRVEKLRLALLKEKEWSDTEYADILSKVPPHTTTAPCSRSKPSRPMCTRTVFVQCAPHALLITRLGGLLMDPKSL